MNRLLSLIAILLLVSCYSESEEDLFPVVDAIDAGTPVSFMNDVNPIIQQSCAIPSCHVPGGSGNGDFTSYEGVKARTEAIVNRAVNPNGGMPQSGPLPKQQRDLIKRWIDEGAPNN